MLSVVRRMLADNRTAGSVRNTIELSLARAAELPFFILAAVVVWLWARRLHGARIALDMPTEMTRSKKAGESGP